MMDRADSPRRRARGPRRAGGGRGSVLLEALVAFTLLGVGLLAIARSQLAFRWDDEFAARRSEAVRLAEAELETLRRSAEARPPLGVTTSMATVGATTLQTTRRIDAMAAIDARGVEIDVAWQGRDGHRHHALLQSVLATDDPGLGGALLFATAAAARPTPGPRGRAASIPADAVDLGNGTSALRPTARGALALVFDNATGAVVKRCDQPDAVLAADDLAVGTLGTCRGLTASLVSGTVRFALGAPPDPEDANGSPLKFDVAVRTRLGVPLDAACGVQALRGVAYRVGTSEHVDTVPFDATPASVGVSAWNETGVRFARYACAVTPGADGRWSGRVDLVPDGWRLGATASAYRVCRYVSDLDGNGTIDANREHPAEYRAVAGALTHQNDLVIRGDQRCPVPATAQHQP